MVNLLRAIGLVAALTAISGTPAQATFLSVSFRIQGLSYDYSGSPACTPEEQAASGCGGWAPDALASGSLVMFDKDNNGRINTFEWVSFDVGWIVEGVGGGELSGTLPVDFDPIIDIYPPFAGTFLDSLSIDYSEIFEGGRPTGRLQGEGTVDYSSSGLFASASFQNVDVDFWWSDTFTNFSAGSTPESLVRSSFAFGDRPPGLLPSPVPLPAAVWLFISALGSLFGLSVFRRLKRRNVVAHPS